MVHKKYTWKGGKRYGPYLYENKRVGEKIVSTYLGKTKEKRIKFLLLYSVFVLIVLASVAMIYFSPTDFSLNPDEVIGVSTNVPDTFVGQPLQGKMKMEPNKDFEKESAFVEITVAEEVDGEEVEVASEKLPFNDVAEPDIDFIENTQDLLQEGGVSEEELVPVVIDFQYLVFDETEQVVDVDDDFGGTIENTGGLIKSFSEPSGIYNSGTGIPVIYEVSRENLGCSYEIESSSRESVASGSLVNCEAVSFSVSLGDYVFVLSVSDGNGNTDFVESDFSVVDEDFSEEEGADSDNEQGGGGGGGSGGGGGGSTVKGDGGTGISPPGGNGGGFRSLPKYNFQQNPVTGGVVRLGPPEIIKNGRVSKEEPFSVSLKVGKTAELVPGSVNFAGKTLSDDVISFRISEGKLEVTTDFSEKAKVSENTFNVDLAKMGITFDKSKKGLKLRARILDGEITRAKSEGLFNVLPKIGHDEIVLGEPVVWTMNIFVSEEDSGSVKIPEAARDISITELPEPAFVDSDGVRAERVNDEITISKKRQEETEERGGLTDGESNGGAVRPDSVDRESVQSDSVNEKDSDVSISKDSAPGEGGELDVGSSRSISGFAVGETGGKQNDNGVVRDEVEEFLKVGASVREIHLPKGRVRIKFTTEAPKITAKNALPNGKHITVKGSDDLTYENVVTRTVLEGFFAVNPSDVRVRWIEGNKEIVPNRVEIVEGVGTRVEFVAPELSEQNFEIIIEISKAEHLDSNREFISDVFSEVSILDGVWSETINDGEYVRVMFERNLSSENDITLFPRTLTGNPLIEVYEFEKNETVASFDDLVDNEYNKVFLTNLVGEQDRFDLRVLGGTVEFDHIIDPTPPTPQQEFFEDCVSLTDWTLVTSGSSGWRTDEGGPDAGFCLARDIGNGAEANMTSPSINLSSAGSATLSFIFGSDLQPSVDYFRIYVNNGSEFVQIAEYTGTVGVAGQTFALEDFITLTSNITLKGVCATGDIGRCRWDNINVSSALPESFVPPNITFGEGTTPAGEQLSESIFVNLSTQDSEDHYSFLDFDKSLVSWIRMEDISGTEVMDASSYSNNGTVSGTVAQTGGGYWGRGFDFDGLSSISVPLSASYPTYSIAVWAKPSSILAGAGVVSGLQIGGPPNPWQFQNTFEPTVSAVVGEWDFLVGVQNETHQNLYVNGNLVSFEAGTSSLGGSFIIGTGNAGFSGVIDEVLVFNRALSAEEISALYKPSAVQYENNFTNLLTGSHIFRGYAVDIYGNMNSTEERSVAISGVSSCQELNQANTVYTQTENIFASLTRCINITEENITFNGNGFWIANQNLVGTGIYSNKKNTSIVNANVSMSPATGGYGIELNDADESYIFNNTLNWQDRGLYLIASTSGTRIIENRANNNTFSGFSIFTGSNENILMNNTANGNGVHGFILSASSRNNLTGNIANNNIDGIFIGSNSKNNLLNNKIEDNVDFGIWLFGSSNNVLVNNSLENHGDSDIFLFASSSSNLIMGNIINSTFGSSIRLSSLGSAYPANNNFTLNTIIDNGQFQLAFTDEGINGTNLIDQEVLNYSFEGVGGKVTFKNTQYGEIKFLETVNGSGSNLSDYVNIGNNSVSVKSEIEIGLNRSANVTLYGIGERGFVAPVILRNDGFICDESTIPACHNFTALNALTVVFNVSSWSNYSIGDFSDVYPPSINFTNPTPANNSVQNNTDIYVNLSTSDASEHYAFVDLDKKLGLWMRFDDVNLSGDPTDLSSYSNNATLNNNASINSAGRFASAAYFNGGGNLSTNNNDSVVTGSPVITNSEATFGGWVKWGSFGTGGLGFDVIMQQADSLDQGYEMYSTGGASNLVNCYNSISETSSGNLSVGEWYHIICRVNSTEITLFINGAEYSSSLNFAVPFINENFSIGGGVQQNNYWFNGSVDEVVVFNRDLTNKEVASLYDSSATQYENNLSARPGMKTIRGYAVDVFGNLNSTEEREILIVDRIPPEISFVPPTPLNDSSQTISDIIVNLLTSDDSLHYAFTDFDDSLALWMRFDDVNLSGDPTDLSSYGRNGSLVGDALINTTGRFGEGAHYDGAGDYVALPEMGQWENGESSISAWVYADTVSGLDVIFSDSGGAGQAYILERNDNTFRIRLTGSGGTISASSSVISSDRWYHVVGTRNSTEVAIYLEGILNSSLSAESLGTINTGLSGLPRIGDWAGGGFSWDGIIDEVILFNRSLTSDEISALYDASANQYENNFSSLPDGNHKFRGYATDNFGNLNSTEERFVFIDSIPPEVTINFPVDGEFYTTGDLPLNFDVVLSEEGSVEYTLDDGVNNVTMSTADGFSFTSSNNSIADGAYTFRIYANDTLGNTNYTETAIFGFDTTPPEISFAEPPTEINGSTIDESIINISVTTVELFPENVTVRLYDSSQSEIRNNFSVGGSISIDYTGLADGVYYFNATALDKVGLKSDSETRVVTIDTVSPLIDFVPPTPTNGTVQNNRNIFVNISSSDEDGGHYTFTDLNQDLKLWIRFDDGAGGSVTDLSGYSNNGVLSGGTFVDTGGKFGKGGEFDGFDDFVDVANSGSLEFYDDEKYTWSFWVKLNELGKEQRILFKALHGVGTLGYIIEVRNDNTLAIGVPSGFSEVFNSELATTQTLNAGEWYHVVVTFNTENEMKIYLNGVLDASGSSGNFNDDLTTNLFLGYDNSNLGLNGTMDEVLIFNRVLGVEEVKSLHDASVVQYQNDFTNLADGVYSFRGHAVDFAGNTNPTPEDRVITISGEISSCQTLDLTNTIYTLTQDVSSAGTCFTITAENITLDGGGHLVNYSQSVGGHGVDNTGGFDSIEIKNLVIEQGSQLSSSDGIFFDNGAVGGSVENNTVKIFGNNGNGILLIQSSNLSVKSNDISTFGTGSVGISVISNSNSNNIFGNLVNTLSGFSPGIGLGTSADASVSGNFISTSGQFSYGIQVTSNSNSSIVNNTISTSGQDGYGIYLSYFLSPQDSSSLNEIVNNNISASSLEINDSTAGSVVNYLVYNNSFGEIRWTDNAFLSDLDLNGDIGLGINPVIQDNFVRLNVSSFDFGLINSSANVTFRGMENRGFVEPVVLRDGLICNETTLPSCHNFTALDAPTVVFNVSSWEGSYSIGDFANTPPIVNLISPENGNLTISRTPTFVWQGVDPNGDIIDYEFNITLVGIGGTCSDVRSAVSGIIFENYVLVNPLNCFYILPDEANYYNWSVRARDSEGFGPWSETWAVNLTPVVDIILNTNSVDFGILAPLDSEDTTDNNPTPLELENLGNSLVNITLNASDLWLTQPNPSAFYEYKIRSILPNSFNPSNTQTTFTPMPDATTLEHAITEFNYTAGSDRVDADLRIIVPENEPPGAKISSVTLRASFAE